MAVASHAMCTITTNSYQRQATCLLDSYRSHHPEGHCFVLHVDASRRPEPLFTRPGIVQLTLANLRVPGLAAMRARYSVFELCNALKPFLLRHILETTAIERLCYCDSDLFFFDSLRTTVLDELESACILLTPHLVNLPSADPALIWRDLAVLQHGTYNGGFIAVRRSPRVERFLDWWSDRTGRLGQKKLDEGLNCDQRWLDLVPGFDLDCRISRHPGLNAAYWNLHERTFTAEGKRFLVNGEPLVFFHFSGYSPDRPDAITRHFTEFDFGQRPDLRPVFEVYRQSLISCAASAPASRTAAPVSADSKTPSPESWPVTVVIPARDAARHLAAAIESVLAQTLASTEVIVVDDGSSDDTVSIAERFVGLYGDRVRLRRQAHGGVGAARNLGVEAARGRYIAFLDADDWYVHPAKLAKQAAILDDRPNVGLVHSGWQVVDAEGAVLAERRPWLQVPVLDLEGWLLWQPALPSAMMMRREALSAIGGFDSSLRHLEDLDVALRLTLAGYATAWLDEVTVAYRQHDGNANLRLGDTETDMQAVLDRFFARPELPASIRALGARARCGALRWLALQYCRAGAFAEAIRVLRSALPLRDESSPMAALLAWLAGFERALKEQWGERFDAFALTNRVEWQELLRPHLVGLSAGQAATPATRRGFGTEWSTSKQCQQTAAFVAFAADAALAAPKLDLSGALALEYGRHRSGWAFALRSLMPLHRDGGVWVDAFPEHTFDSAAARPLRAHTRPWLGFLHNPPNMPDWFVFSQSPQSLLASDAFQASLPHCLGLFCLSEYHARWWRDRVDVPIAVVRHPTAEPNVVFSSQRFAANAHKRVVQVGAWLRKLNSIYYLPVRRLRRAIAHQHRPYITDLVTAERRAYSLQPDESGVETLPFLSDDEYDDLLAANLVFMELYDSSANNAIVECLARATPVLVNPLPAVVEYLGPDYPFYFSSRGQAARKAEDMALIDAAHRYLAAHPLRAALTADAFARAVAASPVYQRLDV